MAASPDPVVTHQNVRLRRGAHRSPEDGACVMEVVSMLAGERFCDRPATACPVIGAFLRAYNDIVSDRDRQLLLTCASAVVGSRCPEAESARVQRCARAAVECYADLPRWRRRLEGEARLAELLELAERPMAHGDVDRVGYQLARLLARTPNGRARVVPLVEELVAIGAPGPRVPAPKPAPATR